MAKRDKGDDPGVARRLGPALKACTAGRLKQDEIAALTGKTQPAVSAWLAGKSAPNLLEIEAVERGAGRPLGWVLRRAGFVDQTEGVPAAIRNDPRLSPESERFFLALYDELVSAATSADDVIATSNLDPGEAFDTSTCFFLFAVEDVPETDFYEIEVGNRGSLTYSAAELEAAGWAVQFTLGN